MPFGPGETPEPGELEAMATMLNLALSSGRFKLDQRELWVNGFYVRQTMLRVSVFGMWHSIASHEDPI